MSFYAVSVPSPVGTLTLFADDDALNVVEWGRGPEAPVNPLLTEAETQLNAYFDGKLQEFDIPLNPSGTDFQRAVWFEFASIPYGSVRTYGDISNKLSSHARAVGMACGANPIPIILPCHRVVGSDGKMTGFSGGAGVETKIQLLTLEGAYHPEPDLFD
jgi:methylated-DNA-[protein]-cysteine S-methyltransferase